MPNDHLPMLGAVANGGKTSWDRQESRNERGFKRGHSQAQPQKRGERRALRRMERAEFVAELSVPDVDFVPPARLHIDTTDVDADFDAWLESAQELAERDDDELHAEALSILRLQAEAEAAAFAEDLMPDVDGDGFARHDCPTMHHLPFDPDDIAWGFTVR